MTTLGELAALDQETGPALHNHSDTAPPSSSTGDLLAYLWLTLSARQRRKQLSAADPGANFCIQPQWNWTQNDQGDEPCYVARRLIHACNPGPNSPFDNYPVWPLNGRSGYPDPTALQASSCVCNIPLYNLIQVCEACQQNSTAPTRATPFHIFTAKCNSTDMLTFPHPEAVSIPDWAMTDYRGGATNISSAFHRAASLASPPVDNTTTVDPVASSSSSAATTLPTVIVPIVSANGTTGAAPSTDSRLGMKEGIIIGAAIASVLGLVLFGVGVFFARRRRTRVQGQRLGSLADLADDKGDKEVTQEKPTYAAAPSLRSATRTSYTASFTNSASSQDQWTNSGHTTASYTDSMTSGTATASTISFEDDVDSPFADQYRAPEGRNANLYPQDPRTRLSVSTYNSYDGGDDVSRSSTRSPAPSSAPSSTGAVYGRTGPGSINSR